MFRVEGLGIVRNSGFRVEGLGIVRNSGFRVEGSGIVGKARIFAPQPPWFGGHRV